MTNRNILQPHETYAVLARYGHTGSTLAEALGVNQATVSRWVTRGGVPLDQLTRVCAVLGCTPVELRPECVEVDGVWMAPVSAIRDDVARSPGRSRLARWSLVLKMLEKLGAPMKWVPLDKLTTINRNNRGA